MNPAYHPPQQQLPYGGPPVSGYGQPPNGQPPANQGYGPPPQRGFGGPPGPPPAGPGGMHPAPQMMQPPPTASGAPGQLGFPQFPPNGPSPLPPMQQSQGSTNLLFLTLTSLMKYILYTCLILLAEEVILFHIFVCFIHFLHCRTTTSSAVYARTAYWCK